MAAKLRLRLSCSALTLLILNLNLLFLLIIACYSSHPLWKLLGSLNPWIKREFVNTYTRSLALSGCSLFLFLLWMKSYVLQFSLARPGTGDQGCHPLGHLRQIGTS